MADCAIAVVEGRVCSLRSFSRNQDFFLMGPGLGRGWHVVLPADVGRVGVGDSVVLEVAGSLPMDSWLSVRAVRLLRRSPVML